MTSSLAEPRQRLGRATEDVLLYVEGCPGVTRARTVGHLAGTRTRSTADRLVARAIADGLVEAASTPSGVRLCISDAGLHFLHYDDAGPDDPEESIVSTDSLYPRPSREEIAARVAADLPGAQYPPAAGAPPAYDGGTPLGNFSAHLTARMRALGWDQAAIQEKAGVTAQTAARAINGTGVGLELAGQLAGLVGLTLAVMIGPYQCSTCAGMPPAGFACLECSAEGARL